MGLGMPSSLALVSEMSPVAWRAPLMGMRGIMFAIGNMLAAFIMLLDAATSVAVDRTRVNARPLALAMSDVFARKLLVATCQLQATWFEETLVCQE